MKTIAIRALSISGTIDNFGEDLIIDEYLIHSLPNRTNATKSKLSGSDSFTGYSYSKLNLASYSVAEKLDMVGLISHMVQLVKDGTDKTFSAAELEYILVGTPSEMANQAVVFLQIYMLRLAVDIVPVLINSEVAAMAEAAGAPTFGIGAAVVYLMEILVQPLLETLSIVNGTDQPVIPTTIYITPKGISKAVKVFTKIALSKEDEKKLQSAFSGVQSDAGEDSAEAQTDSSSDNSSDSNSSSGTKSKNSFSYDWGYDQYCFLLLLMTGSCSTELERFVDIINMEANANYGDGTFEIKNAYTCVSGTVSGKYQSILPFDKTYLSDAGFGTVRKTRARSY
jgi:hypothetical protein